MKALLTAYCLGLSLFLNATSKLLEFSANEIVGLFHFIETAAENPRMSPTFRTYIQSEIDSENPFWSDMEEYRSLQLNYQWRKNEFPVDRHSTREIKDLMWIAASHSVDLDDFSQRIAGMLPHKTHVSLLEIFRKTQRMYRDLIWNSSTEQISKLLKNLEAYSPKIEELYVKISHFMRTDWHTSVPFRISMIPIPTEGGYITATPKGNTIFCSTFTAIDEDYLGRIETILHEMCHIIYDEQPAVFQHQINEWITSSNSDFSAMAYEQMNEGFATAIGNGWAHYKLFGQKNEGSWYADPIIDGYGHALYDLVSEYLDGNQQMDQLFIERAIEAFSHQFPNALNNTSLIFKDIMLFANISSNDEVNEITTELRKYLPVASIGFSAPIADPRSIASYHQDKKTKLFFVHSSQAETIKVLQANFSFLPAGINEMDNFIIAGKDEVSKNSVVIVCQSNDKDIATGFKRLGEISTLEMGKIINI